MTSNRPKLPTTFEEKQTSKRLIVVLESASLETVRVGKSTSAPYQLLNCDDHHGVLSRNNKEVSDFRPDITHQVGSKNILIKEPFHVKDLLLDLFLEYLC
jgi:rRNA small subunit pseudouridine methyltransferase Nep1